jgi:signal transduction histidine kinase
LSKIQLHIICLLLLGLFNNSSAQQIQVEADFERLELSSLKTGRGDDLIWQGEIKANADQDLILEFANPFVQHIRVEVTRLDLNGNSKKEFHHFGAFQKFAERPYEGRRFALELPMKQGERLLLITELENGAWRDRVPIRLWKKNNYERYQNLRLIAVSAYFGTIGFTLLYGFIVLAALRARIRFSFFYYFGIGLMLVFALEGLTYQYFWPNSPWLHAISRSLLLNATFIGGFRFLQMFFKTKARYPIIHRISWVLMLSMAVFAGISIGTPAYGVQGVELSQQANDVLFLICELFFMAVPIVVYVKRRRLDALWFALAYGVFMSGLFIATLSGLGVVNSGIWLDIWVWIGVALMHFAISIVILYRIRAVMLKQESDQKLLAIEKIKRYRDLIIQEELERERIGADLHDDAGSRFAHIKMGLSALAHEYRKSPHLPQLEKAIEDVDTLCEVNRALSHRLLSVSLDKLGLSQALGEYQSRLLKKGRYVAFLYTQGFFGTLNESSRALIYRVTLEIVEGIYPNLSSFRIRYEHIPESNEIMMAAEPLEEDLPSIDSQSAILHSFRTRVELFQENREQSVLISELGLVTYLPIQYNQVSVEA